MERSPPVRQNILVNALYSNAAHSADLKGDANDISAIRQIVAHVGGMVLAVLWHCSINWKFHWRGIYRAIRPTPASLERGREKSGASPIALNTPMP
jgi:hypothetical protein